MKTDGAIRVGTKLDTQETKADLKKLENECGKTAKKIESLSQKTKSVFSGNSGIDKFANDCENAASKLEDIGEAAKSTFTGMSKGQLESALKKANKELEKTKAEIAELDSQIAKDRASWEIDPDLIAKGDVTQEQIEMQRTMGDVALEPLLKQREELIRKLSDEKEQLEIIKSKLEEQKQAEQAVTDEVNRQKQAQADLKASGKEAANDASWLNRIETQKQYNRALADTKAQMAAIEQQAERLSAETGMPKSELLEQDAAYQKLAHRLEELEKRQNDYQDEVKQSTRQTKKMGDAGEEAGKKTEKGFKKAESSTKHINTNLKKGIKHLSKMALACMAVRGAFTAVRKAADTYLEDNQKLQQQISSIWYVAGQALGPFIETFVQGLSTVIVWVNSLVKALTGVDLIAKANAAALKKQASATKETAKEAAKAAKQLASFDEMNKLSDEDTSSSASEDTTTPAATFDVSMAGDIPDFLEKIKQQILDDDWYGAGTTLAESLMSGIRNFNWNGAGNTLGKILTGVLDFALGFLTGIDLSDTLNGLIDFFSGFFDTVSSWLQNKDWGDIGYRIVEQIWDGLVNTDWGKFAKSAAKLIGSLLGALTAAITGAVTGISKIAASILSGIFGWFTKDKNVDGDEAGKNIIEGLWEGIKDAFKNAGKWIYDNIWVPFRDGFKEAFGIHSPSTKMKEFGGYLIEGLKNGIGNIWSKIGEKFTEWKTKLTNWFTDTKENFKSWGTDTITKFKSGIGDIWSKISTKFTDAKTKISNWATSLKEKGNSGGTSFVNGLTSGLNTLKTKLKDPINALIGMIEKAINWIVDKLNKLSFDVPDWVPGIGGKKFGFNINHIYIPRLARGAIVNNPGRGVPVIAGEAGKEAVLPLENHTEWMDILADKINAGVQKIVVPIYLNGTKIAEKIIEISNQRNFATNGAI